MHVMSSQKSNKEEGVMEPTAPYGSGYDTSGLEGQEKEGWAVSFFLPLFLFSLLFFGVT